MSRSILVVSRDARGARQRAATRMAQTASCNITYTWPTWVGGNGFGASIDIRNTGPAITNGWSLVFNFPNGQQLQNGWPVSFSQSGSTVTAASNAGLEPTRFRPTACSTSPSTAPSVEPTIRRRRSR